MVIKKFIGEYPYKDIKLTLVYFEKEQTAYKIRWWKNNKLHSVAYSKYIFEINNKRFLKENELICYKDNNKNNFNINNLFVVKKLGCVFNGEGPYVGYKIQKFFHKYENRYQVFIFKNSIKIKTMNYSRYLMIVKENRFLENWEEVDHIDGNKLNDNINNLQILSREENILKSYLNKEKEHYGELILVCKCPNCGIIFEITKNYFDNCINYHRNKENSIYKNSHLIFCNFKCGKNFLRNINKETLKINSIINTYIKDTNIKNFICYNFITNKNNIKFNSLGLNPYDITDDCYQKFTDNGLTPFDYKG